MSKIQIERTDTPFPGTYWRPISRVTSGGERLHLDQLQDALSGKSQDVLVEDPYTRGRMLGKFVMDRDTLVVAHQKVVDRVAEVNVGRMSVIGQHVRLGEGIELGSLVELQPAVTIEDGVRVGDRTALLKNATLKSGVSLGSMMYVGKRAVVGEGSSAATGTIIEQDVRFGCDVEVGRQVRVQRGTDLYEKVWVDDGADIGRRVHIKEGAWVGEAAQIGHYTVVEEGAIIGAEAVIGNMVEFRPHAWVTAGQQVPGRDQNYLGLPLNRL